MNKINIQENNNKCLFCRKECKKIKNNYVMTTN